MKYSELFIIFLINNSIDTTYEKKIKMPKINKGIIQPRGELDGKIYSDTRRGIVMRSKAAAGSKKGEPALKKQYSRTVFLNKIAGEINSIIKLYGNRLVPNGFYAKLQSIFRKEPADNRLLLLSGLEGMEINPRYQLGVLNALPAVTVTAGIKSVQVELVVKQHPILRPRMGNCYFFEVLLVLWDKSNKPGVVATKKTKWIYPGTKLPEYEFNFTKNGKSTDYLLCIRESTGKDEEELDLLETQGMLVVEAGCFDEAGKKLLKSRQLLTEARRLKEQEQTLKKKEIEERVEPRKGRS